MAAPGEGEREREREREGEGDGEGQGASDGEGGGEGGGEVEGTAVGSTDRLVDPRTVVVVARDTVAANGAAMGAREGARRILNPIHARRLRSLDEAKRAEGRSEHGREGRRGELRLLQRSGAQGHDIEQALRAD